MESSWLILLEIDRKPPLPEEPAPSFTAAALGNGAADAVPPQEVMHDVIEEDQPPEVVPPLWARILGFVVIHGIEALLDFISSPGF